MNDSNNFSQSDSSKPDLDWSQIRETVLMLNLAIARIEHSMREGDDSVNKLTDSVTSMIGSVKVIEAAASDLETSGIKDTILDNCQDVSKGMQSTVMAFQFYDRLTQRLANVSKSLTGLTDLINNPAKIYNPYEWQGLQQKIRSQYILDSEQQLLDDVLKGKPIEQVVAETSISTMHEPAANKQTDDDIELF